MIESFVLFCTARSLHAWQQRIDLHCDQTGVDHRVFAGTGVYIESFDIEFGFAGVKALILDLAFGISVQRIGVIGAEFLQVKMCGSRTDLFIRCECDTDRSVRDLLFDELFGEGKDLGDSSFVVGAQDRGAVGGDQGAPFQLFQMFEILRA